MVSKLYEKKNLWDCSTFQNTEIFLFLPLFGNMSGVEELYKQFGILADAKEKAGEVRTFG